MNVPPELEDTRGCLCFASRRAARAITRRFDKALKVHGLKSTQFSILSMLLQLGPIRLGALASGIGVERTSLTRNLGVLEGRGLVSIEEGEDARARIVEATANARDTVLAALPDWQRAQHETINILGQTGADALRRLSQRASVQA